MCGIIKLCVGAIGAIGLLAYSLFRATAFLDAMMLNDCHRMVDALSYNHSGTIYHLGPIETLRVEPTLASCVATELFSDRLGLPSIGAGSSPVLAAASRGRTVWLAALIDAGADPDFRRARDGTFPLYLAAKGGHAASVRLLLAAGADQTATAPPGERLAGQSARSALGQTALGIAATLGHHEIVKLLATSPDLVNSPTSHPPLLHAAAGGALYFAAQHAADKDFPGVEKKMREMYARQGGLYDKEQSEEEYVKIIETLIDRGANLDARDAKEGCPAIVLAARHGKAKIIEALLGHGADVNAACTEGLAENMTALVAASVHGEPDAVRALLAAPSCDCRPAQAGFTPVILAAHLGRNEVLELLAESKKCDLDAAIHGKDAGTMEGKTAAHQAAENNQWQSIDILGRHGANLDVTDKWGQTPHHAALYFKFDKVLEALERHGAQWSPPPELPPEL